MYECKVCTGAPFKKTSSEKFGFSRMVFLIGRFLNLYINLLSILPTQGSLTGDSVESDVNHSWDIDKMAESTN